MPSTTHHTPDDTAIAFEEFKSEVLQDLKIALISREMSLIGRKEVLTGKAKFGIFGDGKELAQIALAKAFQKGDWRSGYYRDQTWMLALGELTVEQFFAQLYANPDQEQDPFSAGRQMNAHFATRLQDENGDWLDQTQLYNSTADASPTACQMPRSLGVALASKMYRNNPALQSKNNFSEGGNEVSFVSIGDASTSEGHFWETVNAAGVLQVPLAISVWDDGYGISVPKKYQTTKGSISEVLSGFQANGGESGIDIYVCEGWNYPKLVQTYSEGIAKMRKTHRPALFHIIEVTQPQGHSTSGSHERYKNQERLEFEKTHDCIVKFKQWMLDNNIVTNEEIDALESECKAYVLEQKKNAWQNFSTVMKLEINEAVVMLDSIGANIYAETLQATIDASRRDILKACKQVVFDKRNETSIEFQSFKIWVKNFELKYQQTYSSHLYSESPKSAMKVQEDTCYFQCRLESIEWL
jgi:TPP-dependent pyruvate/acetoin dehydrogenase alpha subunit